MMDDPLISVVIPVYNAELYLKRCLDSVIGQSFKKVEIICVDDGSTDNSRQILIEYQQADNRIRLIQQKNQYAGIARNNGMDVARGKYIIFWDADDCFREEALEKLYERAERTTADIVICDADGWDAETNNKIVVFSVITEKFLPDKEVFSWRDVSEKLFQITSPCPWNKLFRLDFLRKKRIRFSGIKSAEDVPFSYTALAEAERISILNKKLIQYSKYLLSSLESTRAKRWEDIFLATDALYQELIVRKEFISLQRSFDNFLLTNFIGTLSNLDIYQSFYCFYVKFNGEVIRKYGLDQHDGTYYYDATLFPKLLLMKNCSPEEYLLSELQGAQKRLVYAENGYYLQTRSCELLTEKCELLQKSCKCKSWIIPESVLPQGCKVVIYGAGEVGRDFYRQIQREKIFELVAWVDQRAGDYRELGLPVEDIDFIRNKQYDFLLISVLKGEIAREIRRDLLLCDIPKEKLLWVNLLEG